MAKRGKRPEEYGQLALFEEKEPDWLKPVDPLGYSLDPDDSQDPDAGCNHPFDTRGDAARSSAVAIDESDDLVQFAEWLAGKRGS